MVPGGTGSFIDPEPFTNASFCSRKRITVASWSHQSCKNSLTNLVQKILYKKDNANLLWETVGSGRITVVLLKDLHFKKNVFFFLITHILTGLKKKKRLKNNS